MKRREFIQKSAVAAIMAPFIGGMAQASPLSVPSGVHTVSFSCDGKTWFTDEITQAQMDSAVYDPETGMKELTLSVELPDTGLPYNMIRTSGTLIGIIPVGPQPQCVPCGFIIAVAILIVGGIMFYYLLKLCKTLSKNKNKDDDNS